jgi:hypothetical protein
VIDGNFSQVQFAQLSARSGLTTVTKVEFWGSVKRAPFFLTARTVQTAQTKYPFADFSGHSERTRVLTNRVGFALHTSNPVLNVSAVVFAKIGEKFPQHAT